MMKTIPEREFEKFRAVLHLYYHHMRKYKDSLISRFYGLHEVVWTGSDNKEQKRYLVIMNNVFTDFAVGVKFDLKGSV
jgi:1-phosphatidylinositol-4-phosphate 5-kinase